MKKSKLSTVLSRMLNEVTADYVAKRDAQRPRRARVGAPRPFVDWPHSRGKGHFAGQWSYGVDFSAGAKRVVAVATQTADGDSKYGFQWIGPIALTEDAALRLENWAEAHLDFAGGYVHLLPADGEADFD